MIIDMDPVGLGLTEKVAKSTLKICKNDLKIAKRALTKCV